MSDSIGDGRFNLPDYDQFEDESFPPLPAPRSPGLAGDDPFGNGEEDGDLSKLADVPTAKRRTVKRPQPKLDSQRLTSERGLPALRTLFDNVSFKGKGHEAEDLRVVMQKMENWAHRLYPKLQFDDFMDKVEKLGSKKDVQTCLKRIRLDMPLVHEDFIGEKEVTPVQHVFEDPDPFGSTGRFPLDSQGPVHSTPAPTLTEEQLRRIKLNKQLALERRLARKQPPPTDLPDSQAVSYGAVSAQTDSSQAVSAPTDSSQAVSAPTDSSQAVSAPTDSSQAISDQAASSQAISDQAASSQAISDQAASSQAISDQAASSQAISDQAASSQAISDQAASSQAVSAQAASSQAVSAQTDSSQAISDQAASSQAISDQAASSQAGVQASSVNLPPAISPSTEPCPLVPRFEERKDMDVGPSTEPPRDAKLDPA